MSLTTEHLAHLKSQIAEAPNLPGVYFFHADTQATGLPLYIGKSIHIKKRLLSHCYLSAKDKKEARLLSQVNHICWQRTAGDLGAQLLEASLIKKQLPLFNRRLRRTKRLVYITLESKTGNATPIIRSSLLQKFIPGEEKYGLFRSEHQAKSWLLELAKTHGLCQKILGLEKGRGPCFAYQLKQCRGACAKAESLTSHHRRFLTALSEMEQAIWPYPGPIFVKESDGDQQAYHLIHQWRYAGSYENDNIDIEAALATPCEFDIDHYKIFMSALRQCHPEQIMELGN